MISIVAPVAINFFCYCFSNSNRNLRNCFLSDFSSDKQFFFNIHSNLVSLGAFLIAFICPCACPTYLITILQLSYLILIRKCVRFIISIFQLCLLACETFTLILWHFDFAWIVIYFGISVFWIFFNILSIYKTQQPCWQRQAGFDFEMLSPSLSV